MLPSLALWIKKILEDWYKRPKSKKTKKEIFFYWTQGIFPWLNVRSRKQEHKLEIPSLSLTTHFQTLPFPLYSLLYIHSITSSTLMLNLLLSCWSQIVVCNTGPHNCYMMVLILSISQRGEERTDERKPKNGGKTNP